MRFWHCSPYDRRSSIPRFTYTAFPDARASWFRTSEQRSAVWWPIRASQQMLFEKNWLANPCLFLPFLGPVWNKGIAILYHLKFLWRLSHRNFGGNQTWGLTLCFLLIMSRFSVFFQHDFQTTVMQFSWLVQIGIQDTWHLNSCVPSQHFEFLCSKRDLIERLEIQTMKFGLTNSPMQVTQIFYTFNSFCIHGQHHLLDLGRSFTLALRWLDFLCRYQPTKF